MFDWNNAADSELSNLRALALNTSPMTWPVIGGPDGAFVFVESAPESVEHRFALSAIIDLPVALVGRLVQTHGLAIWQCELLIR